MREEKARLEIELSKELLTELKKKAAEEEQSIAAILRRLIKEYIKEK